MSYYDIGVPCKLLPPGDHASLLAVFFFYRLDTRCLICYPNLKFVVVILRVFDLTFH